MAFAIGVPVALSHITVVSRWFSYADGGDVRRRHAELLHRRAGDLQRRVPYLHRVMLYPAGVGEYLREFLLHGGAYAPALVEQDTARACCALVKSSLCTAFGASPSHLLIRI